MEKTLSIYREKKIPWVKGIDVEGKIKNHGSQRTDTIGWHVPAVPCEDTENGYWGYSAVPPDGVQWGQNLPNRSNKCKK